MSFKYAIRMIANLSSRLPWVSLHDVSELEFRNKHYHVLGTKVDPLIIGTFLSIMHYNNVMNSRSESSIMAAYLGISDEYAFYCGASAFYRALYDNPTTIGELLDADYEDQCNQVKLEKHKSKIMSED